MKSLRFIVGFPFFACGVTLFVISGFLMGERAFDELLDGIFNPRRDVTWVEIGKRRDSRGAGVKES